MKIKKVLLVLGCFAIVTMLFACEDEATTNKKATVTSETDAAEKTKEETAAEETEEAKENVVLCDDKGITIIYTGYKEDTLLNTKGINISMNNTTKQDLIVGAENVSINNIMCDPFWAADVNAGKSANNTIEWFDTQLKENKIEDIKTITLDIYAMDNTTYDRVFEKKGVVINLSE